MSKTKQPTWTMLVMQALAGRDDFMTARQLCEELRANCNQMSATLVHLRKRRAIDCIVEPDGKAWWFATPASDNRQYSVNERTPECEPRKRRRRSAELSVAGHYERARSKFSR